jgi:hypothetical protein
MGDLTLPNIEDLFIGVSVKNDWKLGMKLVATVHYFWAQS